MTPDNCPLCGTSVALLRQADRRAPQEILRDRIATLRERAAALGRGDIPPRRFKDEALWMCPSCQRVMTGLPQLDPREMQRRIHEEVRRLRPRRADRGERQAMKTDATTTIIVEGLHHPAFARRIRTKIAQTLGRVDPPPTTAKVIFADENGPKGGPGIRCTIVHDMPRRRDFSVHAVGTTEEIAWDAAFDALATSIQRDRDRRRELVRRPKKYFLAKRLLEPDTTLEAPEVAAEATATRPKRARRRRVA